jgi:hypothetical protein
MNRFLLDLPVRAIFLAVRIFVTREVLAVSILP